MMEDMIPVFREGSLAPLDGEHVARLARRASARGLRRGSEMATYEAVPVEGLGDLHSCLRRLAVGQKMLFSWEFMRSYRDPVRAAYAAAQNAAAYGMDLRTYKSERDAGIWIGRRA